MANSFPQTDNWNSFSFPTLPPGVNTAMGAVTSITSSVTSILQIVKTALKLLSATTLAEVDLTQLAVSAGVKAIDAALASLQSTTGIYVLLIPPKRKVIIPTVVQAGLNAVGISEGTYGGYKDFKLAQLYLQLAQQGLDPAAKALLAESSNATGGTAAFIRTIIDSLQDTADLNRPQMAATDAVAGLMFVGGAPDYLALLSYLAAFDSLIGPGPSAGSMAAPDMPTPRNLRIQQLGIGVQLTWDPMPLGVVVPAFDAKVKLIDAAIIRTTDPKALFARTVPDLFGTVSLTKGMVVGKHEVIDILPAGVTVPTFLDQNPLDMPSYYAVAYHLKGLDETDYLYNGLSNVVKCVPATGQTVTRSSNSVPPDWIRVGQPLSVIPGLSTAIDWVTSAGASLGAASLGTSTTLDSYIKFIDQQITYYGGYADSTLSTLRQLERLAATPLNISAGVCEFAGIGGTPFLLSTIIKRATELQFASTDFVAGSVILATGPSYAALMPVYSILKVLFGLVKSEPSIFTTALAGIGKQIQSIEATALSLGIQPRAKDVTMPSEGCKTFTPTIGKLSF